MSAGPRMLPGARRRVKPRRRKPIQFSLEYVPTVLRSTGIVHAHDTAKFGFVAPVRRWQVQRHKGSLRQLFRPALACATKLAGAARFNFMQAANLTHCHGRVRCMR